MKQYLRTIFIKSLYSPAFWCLKHDHNHNQLINSELKTGISGFVDTHSVFAISNEMLSSFSHKIIRHNEWSFKICNFIDLYLWVPKEAQASDKYSISKTITLNAVIVSASSISYPVDTTRLHQFRTVEQNWAFWAPTKYHFPKNLQRYFRRKLQREDDSWYKT
jgi:hypothetical protein